MQTFLAGRAFDFDAVKAISLAFDRACEQLGLVRTVDDPATKLVVEKIIEVALRGVHDPDLLHTMALNELGRDKKVLRARVEAAGGRRL